MAFPVTLNGRTYTLADFEGTNYVDGLPDAFEDFVTHAGAIYKTTSTTSNTIGTGSKSFTTADNSLPYQVGTPLRITDSAAPSTNWMDGIVTAYSGTSLTVNVLGYAGSGTKTSWNINIGGGPNTVSGTLPVAQGGTGATTAGAAATNLGLGTGDSVTFSGLTVAQGNPTITITDTDGSTSTTLKTVGANTELSNPSNGNLRFRTNTSELERMRISADGDISFYDSTGTSQNLFWDASASRLGLGTTLPSAIIDARETSTGGSTQIRIYNTDNSNTTTQTAALFLSPDSRGTGALIFAEKENADFSTSSSRDVSLVFSPVLNNLQTQAMKIDSSGNVDIGSTGGGAKLAIAGAVGTQNGTEGAPSHTFYGDNDSGMFRVSANNIAFSTGGTERMRITSAGTSVVYFGTTDASPYNNSAGSSADNGVVIDDGRIWAARYTGTPIDVNRTGNSGGLISFRRDGIEKGFIDTDTSFNTFQIHGNGTSGWYFGNNFMLPMGNTNAILDNAVDLGNAGVRFDDIYATNGTIQTSDANEKQDVAELDEAEKRVATVAKGLIRKFRWIDSVEEKGDDARIHVGIIAQDLKAAFEAEGLDPSRYAMFTSNTWWEIDEVVPAVEAVDEVVDEEGRVITEAVEAKPEYTRKNIYKTAEEAPAGAVERTRLGVRYNQLLAFIISAI